MALSAPPLKHEWRVRTFSKPPAAARAVVASLSDSTGTNAPWDLNCFSLSPRSYQPSLLNVTKL